VTLAWDPLQDPGAAGYRVFCGTASGSYTVVSDAGQTCTTTLSGLADGETYFFAVCAYDAAGFDGELSSEISFSIPPATWLEILPLSAQQLLLRGHGSASAVYQILVTETLNDWSVMHQVTAGEDGTFEYRFYNDPSRSARYYRLKALEP
jgi:hypothetical protein